MGFGELSSYLRSTCGPDGRPVVGVERSEADVTSVRAAIERILAETSAERLVRGWRGQRVVLKPNFCREGRRGELHWLRPGLKGVAKVDVGRRPQ